MSNANDFIFVVSYRHAVVCTTVASLGKGSPHCVREKEWEHSFFTSLVLEIYFADEIHFVGEIATAVKSSHSLGLRINKLNYRNREQSERFHLCFNKDFTVNEMNDLTKGAPLISPHLCLKSSDEGEIC